jgi:aminopeptidase C
MGLHMKEKQAVTREYAKRYTKAGRKEKSNLLNDFTALTGYNRKYAVRVLNAAPVKSTAPP